MGLAGILEGVPAPKLVTRAVTRLLKNEPRLRKQFEGRMKPEKIDAMFLRVKKVKLNLEAQKLGFKDWATTEISVGWREVS